MQNRDDIERLIFENLEELQENEPLEGHFERFEAKLKKHHGKRKITLNVVLKVAAAVIFVLLATNQVHIYLSPDQQTSIFNSFKKNNITLASISTEYEEVEFYYTNAINVGMNQWNTMNTEGYISKEEQKMMEDELTEFEERFKALQSDLTANPNDERVINAMLEYYQSKLSVINMIVKKLQEVKQTKINHDVEI